jgi:predicted aminopeptidase
MAARADLDGLYASALPAEDMRLQKSARLEALANDAVSLLENAGRDASGWRAESLNNARLSSMVLYEGRVPEFRALLERCEEQIECFYAEAKALAGR